MVMSLSGESAHWCIVLVVVERDGSLVLVAESTRAAVPCPKCGELSRRQHSSYQRRPLDLPWRGHTVRLKIRTAAGQYAVDPPKPGDRSCGHAAQ